MAQEEHSAFKKAINIVGKFFLFIILGLIGLAFVIFKVDLHGDAYDIIFARRLRPNSYYGIDYKHKFEIWKIIKKEDGSSIVYRVYPQ